jgi:hypothetical protein
LAAALGQIAEAMEHAAKAHDLASVRRMHDAFSREVRRVAEQAGQAGL